MLVPHSYHNKVIWHELSGLNNRNAFSYTSEGQKFEVVEPAGLVLAEATREGSVPGPSAWLVGGHFLPVSSHPLPSVCVCIQISLIRTSGILN